MKQLKLFIIITALFVSACEDVRENVEKRHSLNGTWLFNTLYGDGSNYLNVFPTPEDKIIDNSDRGVVEMHGEWSSSTSARAGIMFHGDDYLIKRGVDSVGFVRFNIENKSTKYLEVFAHYPFGFQSYLKVVITHENGVSVRYLNQRHKMGQWISLGIYEFGVDSGKIDFMASAGAVVDAIMLRKADLNRLDEAGKAREDIFLAEYDDSGWDHIPVPGHWGMINKYSNYTGKGWYRKRFSLPENWRQNSGNSVYLNFEGVYHLTKVYLNGEYLGHHQGGFTPFQFDITDHINKTDEHLLALEVDNDFQVGATWNWGGIIRDVYVSRENELTINDQFIHAKPNLETGEAEALIAVRVNNQSKIARDATLSLVIYDAESHKIKSIQKDLQLSASEEQDYEFKVHLEPSKVKLWHFDTPNLYQIKTTLIDDEVPISQRTDRFGIRLVELTDNQLVLNGEPVRLAGFNRVSEHRYWGSSEPRWVLEQDVDLMKNAGANFMRIMHGTQNEELIKLCDEKGILIFEEVNVRSLDNPEFSAPNYPLVKQWLKEMIMRDRNHPSIIGWSVGNELNDHYAYVEGMMNYVRNNLDPYRFLTCVSYTGHREDVTPLNDPITEGDIVMMNCYHKTPELMIEKIGERWPDKPLFFSEFGITRFSTTSLDEDLESLGEWYSYLRGKNQFVVGASLWTFNDYRSSYIETGYEENRTWGAVNVWRQPKQLYYHIQKENSPVEQLYSNVDLQTKTCDLRITTRDKSNYPSYSLKNYDFQWTLYDSSGEKMGVEQIDLPELESGDIWSGNIDWTDYENVGFLHFQILSPNGYSRYEERVAFSAPIAPRITNVVSGDGSVRILFDKVFGANSYYVRYSVGNQVMKTEMTIQPHIDVKGLDNNKAYDFQVLAVNDYGESPSGIMSGSPNGSELPPVIWDSFITDQKMVIGYSSAKADSVYLVRYGSSDQKLEYSFTSNVRGMITVDIDKDEPLFFQLARITADGARSNWSQVVEAELFKQ